MKLLSERFKVFCVVWGSLTGVLAALALLGTFESRLFFAVLAVILLLAISLLASWYFLWAPYRQTTRRLGLLASRPFYQEPYEPEYAYNQETRLFMMRWAEYLKDSTTLEMNKRQAQYQALQNQINPHFLYNTLESIRSEALMSGLSSVANMCEALAAFFRYTISNMENLVTVEEELENIKNYFCIQQYRFGERLHLLFRWEEEDRLVAEKCLIPKLTLQPIVENAIIHGIEQKIGDGTVTIEIQCTERRLLIHVSDDGIGMDQETLDRINQSMEEHRAPGKSKGGIAIRNVNTRLKMLFGDEYGVTVFSNLDVGTEVEITLPLSSERDRKAILMRAEALR